MRLFGRVRACLKNWWDAAARDFGWAQDGMAGVSPQRAMTAASTLRPAERPAVRAQLFFRQALGLVLLLVLVPFRSWAGGDEVVVVYNSTLPESRQEHYAARRNVPASQIFGFPLTTNEVISRDDFTDQLQKPLAQKLADSGIWKFDFVAIKGTNGQTARVDKRVVQSKIRYAVLCYGVPLKIAPKMDLDEVEGKLMREEFRRNEAAVDSELAWLPLVNVQIPVTGLIPNGYYHSTNRFNLNPTNGILMVTRLDGPTAQIASNLVDKAISAEQDGLWGRAYVDARGITPPSPYYLGDEWMLNAALVCRNLGFDTAVDTNNDTFPAGYPMDHIAIYAGWYATDACGPFAATKVEFMPGAFAYHLHSFSADTLRSSTRNWCGPLLAKGATCTMGCVYEPYLSGAPDVAFFLQAWANGYTFGEAAWSAQAALSWQSTVIGDPLYQPFGNNPIAMHARLTEQHSPLLEWSFDRFANVDHLRGAPLPSLIKFIADNPLTTNSAVLTEKLAELEMNHGDVAAAINDWKKSLQRNPSPEQDIRIRLKLAELLEQQHRPEEAVAVYRDLAFNEPDYAGMAAIREKIKRLQSKPPVP